MARRYSQEELLHLRESPLVVKPDSLPPIEEWMGPLVDASTQKKHTASKEQTNQTESTASARRSSFFEPRHISRSSNSEDIILGPPKTSFSSSTRGFGKFSDPDRYNSLKSPDGDGTKSDRFPHRDKFLKDKDSGDRDRDLDKRDSKSHITNGRRSGRDDKDDWGTRSRRTFGQEETVDRRVKREGDRWDSREFREHRDQQEAGNERGHRGEQGKYPNRRDVQGKSRHDHPSWFRDGDSQENAEQEDDKTPIRNREWRRGVQGQDRDRDRDRDWNRSTKHEQDPEWMDSSNKSDHKEAHTQEDFQRWKERMKSGGAPPSDETKKKAPEASSSVETKPTEIKRTDGEIFSSLEPAYKADVGFDDFFGPWGGSKSTQDPGYGNVAAGSATKEPQAAKPAKSSRFAGFFNSPTEAIPKEAEATVSQPRPVSTDADQEGFQRILQLLGGNKSRNSTPQAEEMMRPKPTPPQQIQQEFSHIPAPTASPHHDVMNRQPYMGYSEPHREQTAHGLEQLIAQKAPKESQPSPFDSNLLLRLMQQAKIGQSHQGQMPAQTQLQNPGAQNMPDIQPRNHEIPKQKSPLFFDDPAIANMQRPDPNDPRSQLRRRATGGPPGYYDEMQFQGPSSGSHTPANPPGLRTTQSAVQPSMNIQRPPGLEQVTPPGGWPNPQQLQQGPSAQFIGRPGMPNPPPNRNLNQSYPPVQQMPMPGGIPPLNDRQAFQRGPGAAGPSNFGPPPGIVPPPGYMAMNPPPPLAFPPMPHNPEGMMGLSHGHPAHFGAGPQPGVGGHQPSSRQLLEMFTGHGGGPGDGGMGNRNGSGMMGPPYR
ncbi:hypothetical protein A7D00_2541 [Trichophyton violaceum]|uniref:Uncharacterized protein n=1 Tax=Trichophyton violaceum TaxID=34388 RepID=A0A178FKY0_TRIVO|nr:hypothetical protein A7D00_2541 [Trichophyton violaceum]